MSEKLLKTERFELTRCCGRENPHGTRTMYQINRLGAPLVRGEDCVVLSQSEGIRIALRLLKDAFEERGLNCAIAEAHPFEVLNSIGGLLGENPGFDPSSSI